MPVARKRMATAVGHIGAHQYQRRQPEQTQLYQLVERYYPEFRDLMASRGRRLPEYVHEEFEAFLKCGRLEYGFLRVRCGSCQHERLVALMAHLGYGNYMAQGADWGQLSAISLPVTSPRHVRRCISLWQWPSRTVPTAGPLAWTNRMSWHVTRSID